MMNSVRNMARLMSDGVGRASAACPCAVRRNDSTITMRVNDVIIMKMEGASESTVSSATIWMTCDATDRRRRALAEVEADAARAVGDEEDGETSQRG